MMPVLRLFFLVALSGAVFCLGYLAWMSRADD